MTDEPLPHTAAIDTLCQHLRLRGWSKAFVSQLEMFNAQMSGLIKDAGDFVYGSQIEDLAIVTVEFIATAIDTTELDCQRALDGALDAAWGIYQQVETTV